ncbi:MAG: hypothetical protein ACREEP_09725, partial [Dongiaceae bacterium]
SSLPEYTLTQFLQLLRNRRFVFDPIAEAWINAFGRDAVRIAPIERVVESGTDLVAHTFQTLLGIEADKLAGRYKSNRSLSPEQLELIRAVSICRHRRYGKASMDVSFPLRRLLRRGDAHVVAAAKTFTQLRVDLSLNDQHPPFLEMERDAIAKFGDLIEGADSEAIFPPREPRQVTYIRDIYWLDRGFLETIEAVYAYVRDRNTSRPSPKAFPRRAWQRIRGWLLTYGG